MTLRLLSGRGCHPQETYRYFAPARLSAFHRQTILNCLFGDRWTSILVTDGQLAMLHCFTILPIQTSPYFDIDAWIGYAGPLFNDSSPPTHFVREAFSLYRNWCWQNDIVAEVIRFDPVLSNHDPFRQAEGIHLVEGRPIAYAPCHPDSDDGQLSRYTPACRRSIRAAKSRYELVRLDKCCSRERRLFFDLYHASLRRVGALRRWYFDREFADRVSSTPEVELWAAMTQVDGELRPISAILSVADERIGHSLLVANLDPRAYPGAHDYLTHGLIRSYAAAGREAVCLGGGGRNVPNDSLLRFKLRFCAGHVRRLIVGTSVHNPAACAWLTETAQAQAAVDARLQPTDDFLRDLTPYRWA